MKSKILNERVPTDYQNDYILRSKELEMDRIKNRIEILKVKRQKLYNQADSEFHGEYDNPEWGSKVHELNDRIRNPLSVILTLASFSDTPENVKISEQVEIIDSLVDELDKGFVESEKVRKYLIRYFQADT